MSDKEQPFAIGANAIQLMMNPSGLVNPEGKIKSNLGLDAPGVTLACPAELFPFLKPGVPAVVTISVVQIAPAETAIAQQASGLVGLNGQPL